MAFVGRMHDWLEANNDIIFAHIYFDVTAPDGDHAISGRTNFQNAADEFAVYGGRRAAVWK